MPEALKLIIILGSFAIMIFLFVLYPIFVARKFPNEVIIESNPAFNPNAEFKLFKVRNFGDMVSDTFSLYRRNYKYFYKSIWFLAIPICSLLTWFTFNQNKYFLSYWENWRYTFGAVLGTGKFMNIFNVVFLPVLFSAVLLSVVFAIKTKEEKIINNSIWKTGLKKIWFTSMIMSVLTLCIQSENLIIYVCFTFIACFVFLPMVEYNLNNWSFGKAFNSGMKKAGNSYSNSLGMYFVMTLLIIIFSFLFITQGYYFFSELLSWHFITQIDNYLFILQFIQAVLFIIFLFLVVQLLVLGFTVTSYHFEEIEHSHDLYEKLPNFGKGRKMFESSQWE
jgi:hypothetical protein